MHSAETREKISRTKLARHYKPSDEARKKMSEAAKRNNPRYWLGKKRPLETMEKLWAARRQQGGAWNRGIPMSEETRERLSQSLTGRKVWNKGLRGLRLNLTDKQRAKRREDFSGPKNPMWRGGITPENQVIRTSSLYIQWRNAVYERDGYTCKRCGRSRKPGDRVLLNAHHIKPFSTHPELRLDLANGITLCVQCHKNIAKNDLWSLDRRITRED